MVPVLLPQYFVWLDALSYNKYAFTGVIHNEFAGLSLYCTEKQLNAGICAYLEGEHYIAKNGFDYLNKGECALVLVAFIVGKKNRQRIKTFINNTIYLIFEKKNVKEDSTI